METSETDIEVGLLGSVFAASLDEGGADYGRHLVNKFVASGVTEKWFTRESNRKLWSAMVEAVKADRALEPALLAHAMGEGGVDVVEAVIDGAPATAASAEWFLGAMRDREVYRRFHALVMKNLQGLTPQNVRVVIAEVGAELAKLEEMTRGGQDPLKGVGEFVEPLVEEKRWLSEERFVKKNWGAFRGVPLPWSCLNMIYKGLKTGLHIFAALPSQGKTTIAANVSLFWITQGIKHGFVCIDMPGDALAERYAAIAAQLSISKLDFGAAPGYVDEFERTMKRLAQDDVVKITESDTVSALEYEITRGVKTLGWKAAVVDYLQLVDPEMKSANAPYVLVKEATLAMKRLAKKLRIPIVCLVQLSNQFAKDKATGTKKPRLDHLGDSSEIARAARTVAVLWQDEDVLAYWKESPPVQLVYGDPRRRLSQLNEVSVEEEAESRAAEAGQASIFQNGGLRPIWVSVIKNQQGGRGDVPFLMYAKYFLMRPGDPEGLQVEVEEGKKTKKIEAGKFETIRDDWMYNAGDEVLERTGGIGTRWLQFPGETRSAYAQRVKAERAAHNSNSGMWDAKLYDMDPDMPYGKLEYYGEVRQ